MLAKLEAGSTGAAAGGGGGDDGEGPGSKASWKKLQSLMMQLRKCANHPYLFDGADPAPGTTDERIVEASGKLQVPSSLLASGSLSIAARFDTGTLRLPYFLGTPRPPPRYKNEPSLTLPPLGAGPAAAQAPGRGPPCGHLLSVHHGA